MKTRTRLLVVEDERTALQALAALLEDEGYEVLCASRGEEGFRTAIENEPDLILLDVRLPDVDGLTVLERLRSAYCDSTVIIMTADPNSASTIRAVQLGAFDYISKPIDDDHLLVLTRRALDYRSLERETPPQRGAAPLFPSLVGHSPAMQEVYKLIGRVANSDVNVLVLGESGTGKELVANAIHEHSRRSKGPLVKFNCAAVPEQLLEAELFGHEKGAFTNALSRRIGRFEQAHLGTLFLDEVAELTLPMQAKLLRAVQERCFERLGSNVPIRSDFRLIAATARNFLAMVAEGSFREDLYYRLNVVTIPLPPLRERREDIPLLVQRFIGRSERPITIREDAFDLILSHDWPGNVRELENVIARAIVLAPGGIITPSCIQFQSRPPTSTRSWLDQIPIHEGYRPVLRQVEARLIRAALVEAKGNKAEAARILGIQRRLLYEKMRELALPADASTRSD
ncbi:MAG: sigma-54-dependent transcriptional regulator [Bryobacteraceae bacterium]